MSSEPIRAVVATADKPARVMQTYGEISTQLLSDERMTLCGIMTDVGSFHFYHIENGKEKGQPFNRNFYGENFYGNIMICGMGESDVSLSDKEVQFLINRLNSPEAMVELPKQDEAPISRKSGMNLNKQESPVMEHKPLYEWSLEDAVRNNERDLWRESYKENCDCARAIERAINENYHDNCLEDCAKPIIARYGFDRVNWVLANTVQQNKEDGRFTEDNKRWARGIYIPRDDVRWHFSVESHPGLTNIFLNQARKAWQSLGLFDSSHCISGTDGKIDYTEKVVVLKPTVLKDKYKTPECQLFFAQHGNGCRPNSFGRKVYGFHLDNGEQGYYNRYDILGAIKDEHLPDWAKENLAKFSNAEAPSEDGDMTMGGI